MCPPPDKGVPFGAKLSIAAIAAGILYVMAKAKEAPTKPVEAVKPAPAVVHASIPWWVYGLSALVLVVLAAAATLLVVRLLRRRADRRWMAEKDRAWEQHERQRRERERRALAQGPQRELTGSARAWLGEEKTEVKR